MGMLFEAEVYMQELQYNKGVMYTLDHSNFVCRIQSIDKLTDEEKSKLVECVTAIRPMYKVIFE